MGRGPLTSASGLLNLFPRLEEPGDSEQQRSAGGGRAEKIEAGHESLLIADSLNAGDLVDGFYRHGRLRPPAVGAGTKPGSNRREQQ